MFWNEATLICSPSHPVVTPTLKIYLGRSGFEHYAEKIYNVQYVALRLLYLETETMLYQRKNIKWEFHC